MSNISSSTSDEEYANIFDWYTDHSNHENMISDNIIEIIKNKENNYLLDIGAGNGYITTKISKYFKHTTILEPNLKHKINYDAIDNKEVHHNFFSDFETKDKYNLILCSHVLYYIDVEEWNDFFTKILKMLNSGGICIVIFVSDRGEYSDFLRELNENYKNSTAIIKVLNGLNLRYLQKEFSTELKSTMDEENKFEQLIRLFALGCLDEKYCEYDEITRKKYMIP